MFSIFYCNYLISADLALMSLLLCLLVTFYDAIHAKPTIEADNEPDYSGCGKQYQCFGMPNNCTDAKTCTVLLKTSSVSTGAQFNLYWKRSANSTDKYVSVGLSNDQKMGDDSVTVLVAKDGGSVETYQGLTNGRHGINRVNVQGVEQVSAKHENGLLSGSWRETQVTKVEGKTFDLKNNKYYIFLVYGPVDAKGKFYEKTFFMIFKKKYIISLHTCGGQGEGIARNPPEILKELIPTPRPAEGIFLEEKFHFFSG